MTMHDMSWLVGGWQERRISSKYHYELQTPGAKGSGWGAHNSVKFGIGTFSFHVAVQQQGANSAL